MASVSAANGSSLSRTERGELQHAFELLDTDNNGSIKAQELADLLKTLINSGNEAKKQSDRLGRIVASLEEVDANQSLTLDDFCNLMTSNDTRDEMRKAFDMFDQQGKGYVTVHDLERVAVDELGEDLTKEELHEMIQVAGSSDGKVTLEDFAAIMNKKLFA